jgi:predicted transposase YbfD/YdcC
MLLIEQLKQIPDHRNVKGQKYSLWVILFMSLMGSLCGYIGYRPLADFASEHQEKLAELLELPPAKSTPSYSTFRRILLAVEPKYLATVFNVWALGTMPLLLNRLLSLDGKSIKCTSSGGNTSAQNFTSLVSVYDDETAGVVQIQIMQNKKQSEIGVARNLIGELAQLPSGQILSLDALHTQTATVAAIVDSGHDYLITVKQNQPTLYRTIESATQTQTNISHASAFDSTHGRTIERSVSVFAAPTQLLAKWTGLKSVIMVNRAGVRARKSSSETVYYLSSQSLTANTYATFSGEASPEKLAYMRLIRGHWAIENRLHWVKDVTFDEDYPSRTGGHAPVNWAILFTWIVTLVRRAGIRTVPQALRLWANQVEAVFSFLG